VVNHGVLFCGFLNSGIKIMPDNSFCSVVLLAEGSGSNYNEVAARRRRV
jgi:hypothetical protein